MLVLLKLLASLIKCVVACSVRIETDRQTDRQTDTQTKYSNPCCACAPRVNERERDVGDVKEWKGGGGGGMDPSKPTVS